MDLAALLFSYVVIFGVGYLLGRDQDLRGRLSARRRQS